MADLIDRQAAIDALNQIWSAGKLAFDTIKAQPAAQPERKTGRWVDYPITDGCLQCSVCGILRLGDASNFCPNCGARMEDGDE